MPDGACIECVDIGWPPCLVHFKLRVGSNVGIFDTLNNILWLHLVFHSEINHRDVSRVWTKSSTAVNPTHSEEPEMSVIADGSEKHFIIYSLTLLILSLLLEAMLNLRDLCVDKGHDMTGTVWIPTEDLKNEKWCAFFAFTVMSNLSRSQGHCLSLSLSVWLPQTHTCMDPASPWLAPPCEHLSDKQVGTNAT